jgi:acetoacetyl-CoA synthetase
LEQLTSIWKRVLQRSDISPDSNFFDLGGNPQNAVQLQKEISEVFHISLPLLTLCEAPTLSELAAIVEGSRPPLISSVIRLKEGTRQPPVFVMHGMGGSVLEFMQLVRRIDFPHSFYGFQAKGTNGSESPLDRVEAMAQFHLEDLRRIQPQGPYLLVGFSLGALVVYEMARQLEKLGEKISLLILIEGYPNLNLVSFGQWLRVRTRVVRDHFQTMSGLPFPKAISYLTNSSERKLYQTLQRTQKDGQPEPDPALVAPGMQRTCDAAFTALRKYQPGTYSGAIKFVKAASNVHFPDTPRSYWAPLVRDYEEETVPGDHLSLLRRHYAELAKVLTEYLRAADAIR